MQETFLDLVDLEYNKIGVLLLAGFAFLCLDSSL